jgi:hypothetical protein
MRLSIIQISCHELKGSHYTYQPALGEMKDIVKQLTNHESQPMTLLSKYTLATILIVLLSACASKVSYDYDTEYDFSQLKAFTVAAAPAGEDLMDRRLEAFITDNLTAKSFNLNNQSADFRVTHALSNGMRQAQEKPSVSIGAATGSWKPRLGVGISLPVGGNKITYVLKISITDASRRLIWQGQDTFKLSEGSGPDEKSAALSATTSKILTQFPPH